MMTKQNQIGWKLENSYACLPNIFYTFQNPVPVYEPNLVMFNSSLATTLGLNEQALRKDEGVAILAGNKVPEKAQPLAQAYAGHQFGYFTMLGDGRAILIGEQITPSGQRMDIQLKGAGRTPYSRGGDGRAALGPMLREYLISEAMHALGIPTTRSLAVVTTGQLIMRERELPGAILTRVASSHLRVGTFEYAARWGTLDDLRSLAEYALKRHFAHLFPENSENKYLFLLQQVIERQASLIAKWQLVGFIHGVMNTDNMTISGETIDYGPCAFMDNYDPKTVFSSIDTYGRYAYGNQPLIGGWNLARFAETLLPLLDEDQEKAVRLAQAEIEKYSDIYYSNWLRGMRAKLGLFNEEAKDQTLINTLLDLMHKHAADYTNTFLALTYDVLDEEVSLDNQQALFDSDEYKQWYNEWQARLNRQEESRDAVQQLMKRNNPAVIPRNHRVEEALAAAEQEEDYSVLTRFLEVLSDPYAHSPEQREYTRLPEPSLVPYRTFCGT